MTNRKSQRSCMWQQGPHSMRTTYSNVLCLNEFLGGINNDMSRRMDKHVNQEGIPNNISRSRSEIALNNLVMSSGCLAAISINLYRIYGQWSSSHVARTRIRENYTVFPDFPPSSISCHEATIQYQHGSCCCCCPRWRIDEPSCTLGISILIIHGMPEHERQPSTRWSSLSWRLTSVLKSRSDRRAD